MILPMPETSISHNMIIFLLCLNWLENANHYIYTVGSNVVKLRNKVNISKYLLYFAAKFYRNVIDSYSFIQTDTNV